MPKILCLDQATIKTGYSLFDNNELITHGILTVDDKENIIERMKLMSDEISKLIESLSPDIVILEDTQYQNNYRTYQQLSQFQGVIMGLLFKKGIEFYVVKPSEWKSFCGIKGKQRQEQKKNTIAFVKDRYGLDVSEDEADAIGIGTWAVNEIKPMRRLADTELIHKIMKKYKKSMSILADL